MRRICQHNIAGCIGNADPHGNQCGICKQCGEIDKRSKYIVGYRASGTGWASWAEIAGKASGASGAGGAIDNKKTNYQLKYGHTKPLRNGC